MKKLTAGKSVFLSREEKRLAREAKAREREEKKAAREAKKAAREEQKKIAALPSVKLSPEAIERVLKRLDPDGKFSAKKISGLSGRIHQVGSLPPKTIQNRIKARQFQVDMIRETYDEVLDEAKRQPVKGGKKKSK